MVETVRNPETRAVRPKAPVTKDESTKDSTGTESAGRRGHSKAYGKLSKQKLDSLKKKRIPTVPNLQCVGCSISIPRNVCCYVFRDADRYSVRICSYSASVASPAHLLEAVEMHA